MPDAPRSRSNATASTIDFRAAAPVSGTSPRIGSQIGQHRILRLLGVGGMGEVYEAEHLLLQRHVAVKVLPPELSRDQQSLKRFIREAQSAAKLNHPNCVTIYEVGRDADGLFFIAMELVSGGSAADFLKAKGAFHWRDATQVIADACRGLAAAHAAGLIHRDIKPSNIMRSKDDGVVKLADFGLAKLEATNAASLTGTDTVVGTPQYMSPEQCQGGPLDFRTDLYSLGASYYTLLTGLPPYDADKTLGIMFKHVYDPVPDPRAVNRQIPQRVAAVVKRAMAKQPSDRYSSAVAMLADLEAVLSATPSAVSMKPTTGWLTYLQGRHSGPLSDPNSVFGLEEPGGFWDAVKSPWIVGMVFAGLAFLGAAVTIAVLNRSRSAATPAAPVAAAPAEPVKPGPTHTLGPDDAAKWVNHRCSIEMTVQSVGRTKNNSMWFMNSSARHNDPKNVSLVFVPTSQTQLRDQFGVGSFLAFETRYKGKVVRATGAIVEHNGQLQIVIDDLSKFAAAE